MDNNRKYNIPSVQIIELNSNDVLLISPDELLNALTSDEYDTEVEIGGDEE